MEKRLSECLASCASSLHCTVTLNSANDPLITQPVFDSRKVRKGSLFFALPGIHVHGNEFAKQAIEKGAAAVVYEGELPENAVQAAKKNGTVLIKTDNSRFAMSPLSAAFYDYPGTKLCIAGVTGTEGKSTTVFLLWQLLRCAGKKAGFISTVQYSFGEKACDNPEHQTTPEATIVQEFLYNMVQNGCEYAVVEASSHGLSPKTNRLGDVPFDAAVMMNVTHEHLEFHGTYEQYKNDKANLFRNLTLHNHEKIILGKKRRFTPSAVVNAADPAAADFVRAAQGIAVAGFVPPPFEDSSKDKAAQLNLTAGPYKAGLYTIGNVCEKESRMDFDITENKDSVHIQTALTGAFNSCNITAAVLTAAALTDTPIEQTAQNARTLIPVKGRMTRIDKGQPFSVVVDYAHTPSSFYAVFPPIRKKTKGRVISVFGSGGERDTQKRPIQGKIAAEYADIIVLTDEDPRGEDSMELLEMIASGCSGMTRGTDLFLIPDRPSALRKAFSLAQQNDTVLLLGKSHENSIIYKDKTVAYDEISEAEQALAEMGFTENQAKNTH